MGRQIIELVEVLVDRIYDYGYKQRSREDDIYEEKQKRIAAEKDRDHWKQARQDAHEAGELMRAEIETLRKELANAQRELSEQSMVANVQTQQDAAAWQQELDAARAEIETLKGAMAADDKRLRDAEQRIWPGMTWGCDAPDKIADAILHLRQQLAEQQAETFDVRRQRNNETDRLNATNAVSVQQRDEIAYLRARLDEERSVSAGLRKEFADAQRAVSDAFAEVNSVRQQLDAAQAAVTLQRAGIDRLQAFVAGIDNLLEQDRFDRRDIAELLIVLRSNSSATLTSSPTPVAEPLDTEGGA